MPPPPPDAALRILDAAGNRAREGLRVMEDAARFALDDAGLVEALKSIRHGLAGAMARLRPDAALAARDTPGDVGTGVRTESEYRRPDLRSVVAAAAGRTTEALRSIEEYGKTIDPVAAAEVEALRYRVYEAERRLVPAMGSGGRRQWRVCVVLTESLCERHPWLDVARLAMEAGADCVQLREKRLDGGELLDRARRLVGLATEHGADVVVNDRPDVALAAGAAGVHLGQTDLPVRDARAIVGPALLVGVSTSSLEQASAALRAGADVCGVGPMFPTTTKRKDRIAGPAYLRSYLAREPALPPHLAIGGITPENIGELVEAGVRGVAVSGAVCGAPDPGGVVRRLLGAMG
jgi:thiamine-phosphate pyrophosphorylase